MLRQHSIVDAAEYKANLFARVNDPPQMSTPFRLLSKSGQAVLPAMPAKFRTRGRDGVVAYRFGQSENDVPADAMSEAYEQYIERTISAPLGPVHLCAEESPDGFRPSLVEKQQELELRLGQWFDAFQWPQSPGKSNASAVPRVSNQNLCCCERLPVVDRLSTRGDVDIKSRQTTVLTHIQWPMASQKWPAIS